MVSWRDIKDFILSYKYPRNQYFLVSFPKTGRTWLMHMINQIIKETNKSFSDDKSFILNEHDSSEIIIEDGTRNDPLDVYKFTSRFRYHRGRVIFLVRDPRDVIVSHFYQVTKRAKNPFVFDSISEFIRHDVIGFRRIVHFYNLWKKNKHIPRNFLLVSYEDLINNGTQELERVIHFLDINVSQDTIRRVYVNSSAKKMRENEINNKLEGFNNFGKDRNQLKVRNAKIGSYISELSKEDVDYCNIEMKKLNSYFRYKV